MASEYVPHDTGLHEGDAAHRDITFKGCRNIFLNGSYVTSCQETILGKTD
jgi:hypothetical protein